MAIESPCSSTPATPRLQMKTLQRAIISTLLLIATTLLLPGLGKAVKPPAPAADRTGAHTADSAETLDVRDPLYAEKLAARYHQVMRPDSRPASSPAD